MLITAFCLLTACEIIADDSGGEDGYEFVPITYNIGDKGPGGGIVFYYDPDGFTMTDTSKKCYYLEVSRVDMGNLAWALDGFDNTPISDTSEEIGTGRNNTNVIFGEIGENAPAAKACIDYSGGGKNDWFLPSKDELYELYQNRSYVGNLSGSDSYWSSSDASMNCAWAHDFYNNNPNAGNSKTSPLSVRAIRAF